MRINSVTIRLKKSCSKPELDDIKTEYHPHSKRPAVVQHFLEYRREAESEPILPPDPKPWRPFRSRLDFEFAKVALEAALSASQVDAMIKLFHRCSEGDRFTLKNNADFCDCWEKASHHLSPFEKHTISVPYKKVDQTFEVHGRPLWDWALDLIQEPSLAPHFPWTANRFWEIQSALPPNAKPFCFILYADKTKLLSFGTAKGYPVIARCANLPVQIRNSDGVGGGCVVGWLPVIHEDPAESGKAGFINFKRVVWHESFYELLKTIVELSRIGFWCFLFPLILILSADYEEQCIMSLIRGFGGKCPCPICLVPAEQLSDLTTKYPLRTSVNMQYLYEKTERMTREAGEILLKKYGLQQISNVFWRVKNSNPYRALSFDRLHAYHGGLWGDHLWPEIQKQIESLRRAAMKKLDTQTSELPRWRGLNHFNEIMKVSFSNGTKLEDISKLVLFSAHNILDLASDQEGYLLLQCLRSYLELDMYTALEVHTELTIKAGREEMNRFSGLIEVYPKLLDDSEKNWCFPKMHTHQHLFDDIKAKGVTQNYNTKPNEKMHGPLKDSYDLRTNRKDVTAQILRADHWCYVSSFIHSRLNELDKSLLIMEDSPDEIGSDPAFDGHVMLGAKQKTWTFEALGDAQQQDTMFIRFRQRLADFLSDFLPANQTPLPDGKCIHFHKLDTITEYWNLKVNYESAVDWHQANDLLHCDPSFHNHPWYDCILLRTVDQEIFGQLIYLFTCRVGDVDYPLALIQPLDAPIGNRLRKDKDLRFTRVRAKPRSQSEFISVRSIIQGALLARDFDNYGDFLMMNVVDTDMFLRMKKLQQ
ncbi:hypothetical protein JAAARDRAFT_62330 [Jaapia argillacea MUCL 33604]|uniref:Uncharacterized protein n=1 Tax=Jaapia argillacea MUCL 33604 TaxID=933084 RepID=A0A067PNC3_9AGAM|nr:hypothetical protein JAAARDRAFT_62330 [Jaapia argillacea MUCL 33604]